LQATLYGEALKRYVGKDQVEAALYFFVRGPSVYTKEFDATTV
jgi:hypothetical protein